MFRSLIVLLLVSIVIGQDVKGEETSVKIDAEKGVKVKLSGKDKDDFLLCVNGVMYKSECIKLLDYFDPSMITSINVVKGDEAKKQFDTKKSVISIVMKESMAIRERDGVQSVVFEDDPNREGLKKVVVVGHPMPRTREDSSLNFEGDNIHFFLGSEKVTKEDFEKLDKGTIESITKIEGVGVKELYNLEGTVILVSLKGGDKIDVAIESPMPTLEEARDINITCFHPSQFDGVDMYYFVDGKKTTLEEMKKLDRDTFHSTKFYDLKEAKELFNLDGRVVAIKLKK